MPSRCRPRYSVTKVKYGDSFLYRRSEEASWVADRTIGKFSAGWSPEHSSSTLNGCLLLLDRTAARICGSRVARENFWRTFLVLANSRERSSSWELTVMYLVEKWMKPKTSFPKSQESACEWYPEARWSNYIRLSSFFKSVLISSRIHLGLQNDLFHLDFPTQFCMQCFLRVLCTCLLLSTSLTLSHQWLFFGRIELCSSSLHNFPLLRIWLWNLMQTSRKLCCVLRFFES